MTRKDFEAIAKVLNNNSASYELCFDMAMMLKGMNPRFDVDRFMAACAPVTPYKIINNITLKSGRNDK